MSGKMAIEGGSQKLFRGILLLLSVMILVAAVPTYATQCQPLLGPVLALEMVNPILPIESDYAEALQISPRIEGNGVLSVLIHSVVDDLTIEPIGKYNLELPKEFDLQDKSLSSDMATLERWEMVNLNELQALGLHDWSMQLTVVVRKSQSDAN